MHVKSNDFFSTVTSSSLFFNIKALFTNTYACKLWRKLLFSLLLQADLRASHIMSFSPLTMGLIFIVQCPNPFRTGHWFSQNTPLLAWTGIWNHYRGRINQIGVFKRAEITHIIIIITAWKSMQRYSKRSSPNPLNVKPENGILAWLLWTQFTALQCRAVCYSWVVSHVSLALDLNLNPEGLTLIEAGRAPLGTAAKLIQTTATPSWCSVSPSLPPPQRTGLRQWAVCAVYSMSLEDQNNILKFM